MSIDQARKILSTCATWDSAFIAGGYVRQDKVLRNAVFLAYDGAIHGTYRSLKRLLTDAILVLDREIDTIEECFDQFDRDMLSKKEED